MKKKMGYLQVILMIGCIPMLATMVALTVYASGKMKDELVDSTYLRLKACATSVEQYFTWDIREDILEKDDISYQFIRFSWRMRDLLLPLWTRMGTGQKEPRLIHRYGRRSEPVTIMKLME